MAASAGRPFDPNRKYNVVLSERMKDGNTGAYSLNSVQVDPELKIPSKVTSSQIKPSIYGNDEWNLQLRGAREGENYVYSGTRQPTSNCALIFDPATQTFTLDRIDEDYSFANDQTGDGSHSEDGLISALIEQEGEADPDNPYDWRHQLRRMQEASPSPDPFDQLELDPLDSPSPEIPRRDSYRQASTPPGEMSARSRSESEQEDHGFEVEIEQEPSGRRGRAQEQEVEEDGQSEASSDGVGLEIIMDGSTDRKKWGRTRAFGEVDNGGPVSLRSAANSRSPAMRNNESSDNSDEDVDQLRLGSPMQETKKEDKTQPLEEGDVADEEDDDFEADLAADLDEAFQQGGGDEEEEMDAGGGVPIGRYVEASSSESEEE